MGCQGVNNALFLFKCFLVSGGSRLPFLCVSVRVLLAVRRHHDNTYKGNHLTRAGLQFRGLVHHCHGRKQWYAGRHGARNGVKFSPS